MNAPTWPEVVLAALNTAQTVLLAYLAAQAHSDRGSKDR